MKSPFAIFVLIFAFSLAEDDLEMAPYEVIESEYFNSNEFVNHDH